MLAARTSVEIWRRNACAPLVQDGPRLAAARRELHIAAAACGHATTADPGLQVRADNRPLAVRFDGATWRVTLPPRAGRIRLRSRRWVRAEMHGDSTDRRILGVALKALCLDGHPIGLDDPRLSLGWHPVKRSATAGGCAGPRATPACRWPA